MYSSILNDLVFVEGYAQDTQTFTWILNWKVLLLSHSKVDSGIRFFPHLKPANHSIYNSQNRSILHYLGLIINSHELWTNIFFV
jgi:hypothetical protein